LGQFIENWFNARQFARLETITTINKYRAGVIEHDWK
jgi:hypothetical protein